MTTREAQQALRRGEYVWHKPSLCLVELLDVEKGQAVIRFATPERRTVSVRELAHGPRR